MIEKAKKDYFKTTIKENKGDSKTIWKLMKSLGGGNTNREPIFFCYGVELIKGNYCEKH